MKSTFPRERKLIAQAEKMGLRIDVNRPQNRITRYTIRNAEGEVIAQRNGVFDLREFIEERKGNAKQK